MGKVDFVSPPYTSPVKAGCMWDSPARLYQFNGQSWVAIELLVANPPDPVEQFNARRIAARARVDEDQDAREWNKKWEDRWAGFILAAAMSVPLPHDTDRHERLMNYRHRG